MTEPTLTTDPGSWPELPPENNVVKADAEGCEESQVRAMLRELSTPPPYFYEGRRKRCFFPQRKMKWRKG